MAQRVTVELEDDLDGGPADETLRFGLDGSEYEIDLSKRNASTFRRQMAPTSTMPARLDEDSAAGRRVSHRAGSAAARSGRGRKTKASRSANAAASRPALSSSTRPPRHDRDASPDHSQPRTDPRTADPGPDGLKMRLDGCPMPSRFGVLARPRRPTWSTPPPTASSPMSIRQPFANSRASHYGNRDSSSIRSLIRRLMNSVLTGSLLPAPSEQH